MTNVYRPGDRRLIEIVVRAGEHHFTLWPHAGPVNVVVSTSCKVLLRGVERLVDCGEWRLEELDASSAVPMRGWLRRAHDWLHGREELPIAEIVRR